MKTLIERIQRDGQILGGGILKVDSFITHQVDPGLMMQAGAEFAHYFRATKPDVVLTAEISGIAPALATAAALGLPVIYARKTRPITMPAEVYQADAPSHTKGSIVTLLVSPEFILPQQRVLIVDDFLATGRTIYALAEIIEQARAELVGIGAVVEKFFEGGRDLLTPLAVPIYALATILSMNDHEMVFAEEPLKTR